MASIRSLLVGLISVVVISMGYVLPSSATSTDGPILRSEVPIYLVDFVQVDLPAIVADEVTAIHPDRPRVVVNLPAKAALGPIYALSLQTDGHSLAPYHRRC